MVNAKQTPNSSVNAAWPGQPRTPTGQFVSGYAERRGAAIALRLPQSLDAQVRQAVGWQSKADNKALTAWIEAAILEKLQQLDPPDAET